MRILHKLQNIEQLGNPPIPAGLTEKAAGKIQSRADYPADKLMISMTLYHKKKIFPQCFRKWVLIAQATVNK